ncbi:hypothetical protein Bca101_025474 [Brassica carinata]
MLLGFIDSKFLSSFVFFVGNERQNGKDLSRYHFQREKQISKIMFQRMNKHYTISHLRLINQRLRVSLYVVEVL